MEIFWKVRLCIRSIVDYRIQIIEIITFKSEYDSGNSVAFSCYLCMSN